MTSQKPNVPQKFNSGFFRASCSAMIWTGSKYICVKKIHWKRHRFQCVFTEVSLVLRKVPCSSTAELRNPEHRLKHWDRVCQASVSKAMRVILLPTSVAWKQLGVPEIVYGRVSVVCVVFPVSAAVCGCGGKCLSVHLQVHQFVAWAWGVRGVAAAALGADQTQDQREEAHTYWGCYSI